MFYLKKKVTNKAEVEGFMCEAYLIDEIINFASHYFGDDVQTIWNRVLQNNDGGLKSLEDFIEDSCHMLKCKLRITM